MHSPSGDSVRKIQAVVKRGTQALPQLPDSLQSATTVLNWRLQGAGSHHGYCKVACSLQLDVQHFLSTLTQTRGQDGCCPLKFIFVWQETRIRARTLRTGRESLRNKEGWRIHPWQPGAAGRQSSRCAYTFVPLEGGVISAAAAVLAQGLHQHLINVYNPKNKRLTFCDILH